MEYINELAEVDSAPCYKVKAQFFADSWKSVEFAIEFDGDNILVRNCCTLLKCVVTVGGLEPPT